VPFQIPGPNGPQTVTGGMWVALDPATGNVLWRTPDPNNILDMGYVSTANGVVYVGSGAGAGTNNMLALDAATGKIKWGFDSGGSVLAGAAIVDGSVYWGSGYYIGQDNNKLYAFDLGDCRDGR
jgi:polyvinyl alcohol dehydrogenase (cytochrome)